MNIIDIRRWLRNKPDPQWEKSIKKKYGLTGREYIKLLGKQNGKCAVCKNECKTGRRLGVDHDHLTGKVRGLLCRRCNMVVGIFDDPAIRAGIAEYLSRTD